MATRSPMSDVACKWHILISHLLTRAGDQLWEFTIPITFVSLFPTTIMPASTFGFVTMLVRSLLGTSIGVKIDRTDRLRIVWIGILAQAVSVAASGVLLWFLALASTSVTQPFERLDTALLFSGILLSASVGALGAFALDISVERDWVPTVLPEDMWGTMNATMRRIDLVTEITAPFAASGLLMLGPVYGFLAVAALNFVSFVPEYMLLHMIYIARPALALRAGVKIDDSAPPALVSPLKEDEERRGLLIPGTPSSAAPTSPATPSTPKGPESGVKDIKAQDEEGSANPFTNFVLSWRVFLAQPIVLVVFSYTCLWLMALSPHNIVMTAYLKSIAVDDVEIAAFRGVGALMGVFATYVFPFASARTGLHPSSMVSIAIEAICIAAAAVCFQLIPFAPALRYVFMGSILLSRCGLYGFDMGEVQILQRSIPEAVRGKVNSVESSLTSTASLVVFLLGIVFPNPAQFIWLVWVSTTSVVSGLVLFAVWALRWVYHEHPHYHEHEDATLAEDDDHHTHVEPFHYHLSGDAAEVVVDNEAPGVHSHGHYHMKSSLRSRKAFVESGVNSPLRGS